MNVKEYLTKQISTLKERRDSLEASVITETEQEKRASIGEALKQIRDEISAAEEQLANVDEPAPEQNDDKGAERKMNILATMQTRETVDEGTSSLEYRKAFQKYLATGKMEARADESTHTTDDGIGTVIPENLVNKILEKYEQLGVIYNLVTKTSYPVGQTIPVDGLKPVATWVGRNTTTLTSSTSGEGGASDSQKKTLGAAISFTNYKLRCEIRYTEEVSTMTLSAFEELFVRQVGEAMLRSQEWAIIEGDGYGMPKGILHADNLPTDDRKITIPATGTGSKISYKTLCAAEAAIPVEYESGAKWCMTKKTFMSFVGMEDSNGQPIARVNYGINGKPERTLLGRDVVLYVPQEGSKLGNYADTVTENMLFAFIFDFSDYCLNTNYNLGISHKTDWNNEDHKTKAVLSCDGAVIDKGSLVTLTKLSA